MAALHAVNCFSALKTYFQAQKHSTCVISEHHVKERVVASKGRSYIFQENGGKVTEIMTSCQRYALTHKNTNFTRAHTSYISIFSHRFSDLCKILNKRTRLQESLCTNCNQLFRCVFAKTSFYTSAMTKTTLEARCGGPQSLLWGMFSDQTPHVQKLSSSANLKYAVVSAVQMRKHSTLLTRARGSFSWIDCLYV